MNHWNAKQVLIFANTSKVALKTFVDTIAVHAVERCLLKGIEDILSPTFVMRLEVGLVQRIAGESQEHQESREILTRKLATLEAGLETCNRYVDRTVVGTGLVG